MHALDRKVLRDILRMRGQFTAIALVIASGVGVYLGMKATMRSLGAARANYYAQERFGHVFASLKRAPEHVAARLLEIEGVRKVQTRVVADVILDVPGMIEAVTGRLISMPDRGRPSVNDMRLRRGRLPEPGRWEEALAIETFVDAHELSPGSTVGAVINGRRQNLRIVGTALSPEYTYALGPGLLFPDDRRFGVFWIRREALGAAFDMDGAFNDVSLRLMRNARVDEVLRRVDDVLEPYGGVGAIARKDQLSAFFLENEFKQLHTFAFMVPTLFLLVAAFLLNVVFGRIVVGQREEIAAMKAFGYRDREVGVHYAKLVGVVLAVGCALGILLAAWIGYWMTRLYAFYYHFPELPFQLGLTETLEGLGLSISAAATGTWAAILRTVRLPPAEALRPEAPPVYRRTIVEQLGLDRVIPTSAMIILRELERKPLRALFSVVGIAMAGGLTVMNAFMFDSVRHMLNVQFALSQREDVQLTLFEPRARSALSELEHLPGVLHAEPYRTVPVKLRSGHRVKNTSITGVPASATLTTRLDPDLREVPLPGDGLILSFELAEILDVATGDTVRVEILEGKRSIRQVRVARIVKTFVGTVAQIEIEALCRMLGETVTLNGAWLLVDDARIDDLHGAIKETPVAAGITARNVALGNAREVLDESLGTSVTVSLSFSLILAFGVLYNAARITLAERARELASLRVLGFRRGEVATILLGEIALLVGAATPLGLWFGYGLAALLVNSPGFQTEQFRLPLVVSSTTYAMAALTVLGAAVLSSWNAWRKLDRMNIVDVLKTRD